LDRSAFLNSTAGMIGGAALLSTRSALGRPNDVAGRTFRPGPNLCIAGEPNCGHTGGINPASWLNFRQDSTQTKAAGWNTWSAQFAHGANIDVDTLMYTAKMASLVSGNVTNITHNINTCGNAPTPYINTSGSMNNYLNSNGTRGTSLGPIYAPDAYYTMNIDKTVQGYPCRLSLHSPDGTFTRCTLTYTNLTTGKSFVMPIVLPLKPSASAARNRGFGIRPSFVISCSDWAFASGYLGAVGLVLFFVALPEVVAGAAYAAAISATVNGLSFVATLGWLSSSFHLGCVGG